MSDRILTLFGEEMMPEPAKPAPKARVKKKSEEEKESEQPVASNSAEDIAPVDMAGPSATDEAAAAPLDASAVEEKVFEIPDDWKGDKQYYSIGEVAKLFNVKTSHIRFWTNEFKLKVRTTRKGDRLYTPAQVRELKAIHHLVKGRGFTLTGAKAKLKAENKKDVKTVDLKDALIQLRDTLIIVRNKLAVLQQETPGDE